jgi:CheY-like chemotaxis protein
VLLNLFANAVKYNREDGQVDVTLAAVQPDRVRVSIQDTGIGIAADQLNQLFAPFQRLHADQTDIEGTGLGLALSKHLVEAMGGQIGVESTLDEGSTFWIDFPIAEKLTIGLSEQESFVSDEEGPSCKVLYIEDNLSNVRLIEHILLRRPGVELHVAMQGQMGLELAQQHQPDLILMDLHLPDMHGQELLHLLRANIRTEQIPIVVVSADATPTQIEKLMAAGANSYLTKPLDVPRFLRVLDDMLLIKEGTHSA